MPVQSRRGPPKMMMVRTTPVMKMAAVAIARRMQPSLSLSHNLSHQSQRPHIFASLAARGHVRAILGRDLDRGLWQHLD
jgi:hypothetical protein